MCGPRGVGETAIEEPLRNGHLAEVRPVFRELLLGSASPFGVESVSAGRSREGGPSTRLIADVPMARASSIR